MLDAFYDYCSMYSDLTPCPVSHFIPDFLIDRFTEDKLASKEAAKPENIIRCRGKKGYNFNGVQVTTYYFRPGQQFIALLFHQISN